MLLLGITSVCLAHRVSSSATLLCHGTSQILSLKEENPFLNFGNCYRHNDRVDSYSWVVTIRCTASFRHFFPRLVQISEGRKKLFEV